MAEKKEKKLTASTVQTSTGQTAKAAKPVGNAKGLRAGAVILWVIAIVCEVLAFLQLRKVTVDNEALSVLFWVFLVADLVCVIIGSSLWKKANHIAPASAANKTKFWLWNNLGLIVSCLAFIPIIILLLTNKDLDKKTKTIAVIAAIVALIAAGASSIDYNPVSQEELSAAENALGSTTVYWAPHGRVYHIDDDCNALDRSVELTFGTVDQAIAEGRTRLCKFCANRHNITEVVTDESK